MNKDELTKDITRAINCASAEKGSETPDYILAEFLVGCLGAFDAAVVARKEWWDRLNTPSSEALQWEMTRRHEEYSKALNRRVDVENVLLSVAAGKREPLTPEECKTLAQKLGNA